MKYALSVDVPTPNNRLSTQQERRKTTRYGGGLKVCNNPKSPFLTLANQETHELYWFRADCDLWACSECAEKRKTRVAARAGTGTEKLMQMGFTVNGITLTCHRKVRGFSDSIQRWREAWPRLRKRAQYRETEFHYAFFPEQHKSGAMHAHLLVSGDLSQRFWKDHSAKVGLGYMAKVKPVTNYAGAAKYATKYITKSLQTEAWPPGFHRFRFSSQWPEKQFPENPEQDWRVFLSERALDDEMRYWHKQGYRILNTRTGEIS